MQLSYTQHTLDKLENLLKAMDYRVRYEKGNFRTGACVLESSRVVVINKFSNLENKITALAELIRQADTSDSMLEDKQKDFLHFLKQTSLKF